MKKAKLNAHDLVGRHRAKEYQDYDELNCTDCMPFGGSGLHELVRNNPTATYLVLDWMVEDLTFVLDYMAEHDPVTPEISWVLCCPECKSGNLGYVPMSKVFTKTRKCLDCGNEWEAA